MKTKYILKGILSSIFLLLVFSSCENYNVEVVDELAVDRVFSPLGLKALVRNQTNVELNWTVDPAVDHYVVEFSADDETFSTIFKTINVASAQLPITVALEGETTYSIRVKAVSGRGLEDSKWVVGKAKTLSEQIFMSIIDGDILSNEAKLRWIPNSNVTQINLVPGNISHVITAQEKISGIVNFTGLAAETAYTATLLNGTKVRGIRNFTTGVNTTNAIIVKPTDDLFQKITDAPSGSLLVLEPGNYTAQTGNITLAKSITLRGLRSFDKPLLNVTFSLASGTSNLSLIDLDLSGAGIINASVLTVTGASSTYGDFLISGCKVHDYTRSLIAANATAAKINSFTVDNSIVTNVNTNIGADFIDFRNTYAANVTLKKSTFNNCSTSRDFIRMDAATALSGTGLTSTVLIDGCTIYGSTMIATNRILYVRFLNNLLTVRNTLFASTLALYSNQAATATAAFSNNNYFNSANLNLASPVSPVKSDATGKALDPGFTSAATGDFTISNQTLKDNLVGDPRWIK
jgi:hypothetical protein